jgi:hypothetical protein
MTARLTALLSLLLLVSSACRGEDEVARWLGAAREAHAVADRGDPSASVEALSRFLATPPPPSVNPVDARVVRQDAGYRLARAHLGAGEGTRALQVADELLEEGRDDDVFTANLLVVRGQAKEALGRPVDATVDYHEALMINERLLDEALREDP